MVTDEHGLQCVAAHEDGVREHSFPRIPGKVTPQQRAALVGTLGLLDAIGSNYPGLVELTLAKTRDLLAAFPDVDRDVRQHLTLKGSL